MCPLFISMPGGGEWLLIILPLYFLPTIIAAARKHPSVMAIFLLNFFLGWTVIGWLAALIWSFTGTGRPTTTVVVNNTTQAYSQEYKAEKPSFMPPLPQVATSNTALQQDKIDQLRQLKQLLDEGVLTAEEFNQQKSVILGQ